MTFARRCTAYGATVLAAGAALSGCLPQDTAAPAQQPAPQETVTKVVQKPAEDQSTEDPDSQAAEDPDSETTEDAPDVAQQQDETATEPGRYDDHAHVPNPCQGSAMESVWASTENRAGGRGDGFFTMANVGAEPCTVSDYPEVTMYQDDVPLPTTTVGDQQPAPSHLIVEPGQRAGFRVTWWTLPYQGTNDGCGPVPNAIGVRGSENQDSTAFVNATSSYGNDTPIHPCQDGTLHVSGWERVDG